MQTGLRSSQNDAKEEPSWLDAIARPLRRAATALFILPAIPVPLIGFLAFCA